MDNDVKTAEQPTDVLDLMAWLHANRQMVTRIVVGVLAVVVLVGGYLWYKANKEVSAAEALSNIKPLAGTEETTPAKAADADPYLKLADNYSGTAAASRALVIAGGILFDTGKFDAAGGIFERFLREYPDSALASQALIGVAASLEAQGKNADAAAKYDALIKGHSSDPTIPEAKSALARLYIAQNKPELAMHLYEEMGRTGNNDSWTMEAPIQLEELLAKYPNLRKPATPPPAPAAKPMESSTITVPTLK